MTKDYGKMRQSIDIEIVVCFRQGIDAAANKASWPQPALEGSAAMFSGNGASSPIVDVLDRERQQICCCCSTVIAAAYLISHVGEQGQPAVGGQT
jgi:hypothetical protein